MKRKTTIKHDDEYTTKDRYGNDCLSMIVRELDERITKLEKARRVKK